MKNLAVFLTLVRYARSSSCSKYKSENHQGGSINSLVFFQSEQSVRERFEPADFYRGNLGNKQGVCPSIYPSVAHVVFLSVVEVASGQEITTAIIFLHLFFLCVISCWENLSVPKLRKSGYKVS